MDGYLPQMASPPPPPSLHKPNATIIFKKIVVNSKNDSEIWKKASHYFVELDESNPLI